MTHFQDPTTEHPETKTIDGDRRLRPVIGQTFDAVLFDMDGTLIDSTPAVRRSWHTWCTEYGIDPTFLEARHGHPARDIVASLIPPKEFQAAFERIQQIEIAEVADITILPGAAEALHAIAEHRKAIITSCTRPLATARITATGLTPPQTTITADDVTHGKPHPEPFTLGAQRLGFDPTRCLVIEDAPAGLRSAHHAGCTTLAVEGTHTAEQLHADLTITNLTKLKFTTTPNGIHITQHTHHNQPPHTTNHTQPRTN